MNIHETTARKSALTYASAAEPYVTACYLAVGLIRVILHLPVYSSPLSNQALWVCYILSFVIISMNMHDELDRMAISTNRYDEVKL